MEEIISLSVQRRLERTAKAMSHCALCKTELDTPEAFYIDPWDKVWNLCRPCGTRRDEERLEIQIDDWHAGAGSHLELHEYLGLSWEQYKRWVENP